MEFLIKQEQQENDWPCSSITMDNATSEFHCTGSPADLPEIAVKQEPSEIFVKHEPSEDDLILAEIKEESSVNVQYENEVTVGGDGHSCLARRVCFDNRHLCLHGEDRCDPESCNNYADDPDWEISRCKKKLTCKQPTWESQRVQNLNSEQCEALHAARVRMRRFRERLPLDRVQAIRASDAARKRREREWKLANLTPEQLKARRAAETAKQRERRQNFARFAAKEELEAIRALNAARTRERRRRKMAVLTPDEIQANRAAVAARIHQSRKQKLANLTPEAIQAYRAARAAEQQKRRQRNIEKLQVLFMQQKLDLDMPPADLSKSIRAFYAAVKRRQRQQKLSSLSPEQLQAYKAALAAKKRESRQRQITKLTVENLKSFLGSEFTGQSDYQQELDGVTVEEIEAADAEDDVREYIQQHQQMCKMHNKGWQQRGKQPVLCEWCGELSDSLHHFSSHMRQHRREELLRCPICAKHFLQKRDLQCHLKWHSGDLSHTYCNVCGKAFMSRYSLAFHMKTHTGERAYVCQVCNKGFIYPSAFRYHMTIHSGDKPFKCEHCGKQFISKGNLVVHIKLHAAERPYLCQCCGRGFIQRNRLLQHLRAKNACG